MTLPALPPHPAWWNETHLVWEVWWVHDGGGGETRVPVTTRYIEVPVAGSGIVVAGAALVERGVSRSLRPAGCVVVPGRGGEFLWRLGPPAQVVRRLAANGIPPSVVNVERLAAEFAARVPADPWSVDLDRLAERIAAGEMRGSYIAGREPVGVIIDVPPGRYRSEDVLAEPVDTRTVGNGSEAEFSVVPGRRGLWWHQDEALEVVVRCSSYGRCDGFVRALGAAAAATSPRCSQAYPEPSRF